MSIEVDRRIVEMQFNNRQFERGVQQSVESLEELKDGLDLDESTESLKSLSREAGNFNVSPMSKGIAALTGRFSSLGIMGMTAIQNLTNRVVDAGVRMTEALTIKPLGDGFREYETKMNAIQTLLVNTESKGTTLADVNDALAELNLYADKTIYNFAQMTDNASKFTAAGLDLDSAITNVKGLSNVAAGFGVDARRMAGATYQMTQALSAGVVKLIDWKSLEVAGMGGMKLQKEMIETAKGMGIFVDESIPFRETLEKGWLSAEVFTKTMDKMARDPALTKAATNVTTFTKLVETMQEAVGSGWATTWERIIGDKGQSTQLLTGISEAFGEIVGASANARNETLKFWNENGGRDAILKALGDTMGFLGEVMIPIQEAFRDLFPRTTGKRLVEISKYIAAVTSNFKVSEETLSNIKRVFTGLFSVLDVGKKIFMGLGNAVYTLYVLLQPIGVLLLSMAATFGDFLTSMNNSLGVTNNLTLTLGYIANSVLKVVELVRNLALSLTSASFLVKDKLLGGTKDQVDKEFKPLMIFLGAVQRTLEAISEYIKGISEAVYKSVAGIIDKISTEMQAASFNTVIEILNGVLVAGILNSLNKFVESLTGISRNLNSSIGSFSKIFNGVRITLEAYQQNLRAKTLLTLAIAIGILAASLVVLSKIDSERLTSALDAVSILFANMIFANSIFGKLITGLNFLNGIQTTATLLGLAATVLILTRALTSLGELSWDEIQRGLVGVGGLLGMLVITLKYMKASPIQLTLASAGIIALSIALNLMAVAVRSLSKLKFGELMTGLVGVGALLASLSIFLRFTPFSTITLTAVGMIGLSIALNLLATAVKRLGEVDTDKLVKGIGSLGILLAMLSAFSNIGGKSMILASTSFILLGIAMNILYPAIKNIGDLSLETIAVGLGSMAAAMLVLGVVSKVVGGAKLILIGIALNIMAVGLSAIFVPLQLFGSLDLATIGKGIGGLAVALLVLAGGMYLLSFGVVGAATLMAMAGALVLLTPSLLALSLIPLKAVVILLGLLAGVFVVLAGAAALMTPIIPSLFALSISLAVLGTAMFLFGTGIGALGTGVSLVIMAIMNLYNGITDIIKDIGLLIKTLFLALKEALPLLKVIFVALIDLFKTLILSLLDALEAMAPRLIEVFEKVTLLLADAIIRLAPKLVEAAATLIKALLEGLAYHIGDIVLAAVELIIRFVEGLARAIDENDDRIIEATDKLVRSFIVATFKSIGKLGSAIKDVGAMMIDGLVDGFNLGNGGEAEAYEAGAKLGEAALKGTEEAVETNSPSLKYYKIGENCGLGFLEALDDATLAVKNKAFLMGAISVDGLRKGLETAGNPLDIPFQNPNYKAPPKAMSNLLLKGKKALYNAMGYKDKPKKTTIEEEIKKGLGGVGGGSTGSKSASSAAAKKEKTAYDKSMEWIEEKKFYTQLSLKEELEAYERMQKRYSKGSEEHKKLDRKIFTTKNALVKESYNHSKKWIDNEVFYNRLGTRAKIEAWKRIQDNQEEGSELHIEATKEIYKLERDFAKKQEELNRKIDSRRKERQEERYQKNRDIFEDEKFFNDVSLADQIHRIEELNKSENTSWEHKKEHEKELFTLRKEKNEIALQVEEDLNNVREKYANDRLDAEEEYYDRVTEINDKLSEDITAVSDKYLNAVRDRTNAIYSSYGLFSEAGKGDVLSPKQIQDNLKTQINSISDFRMAIERLTERGVDEGFIDELQELGPKSSEQIKAISKSTDQQLKYTVELWRRKGSESKMAALQELRGLKEETILEIEDLNTKSDKELEKIKITYDAKVKAIKKNALDDIEALKNGWIEKVGALASETEIRIGQMATRVSNALRMASNMEKAGSDAIAGYNSGMASESRNTAKTAEEVANNTLSTVKKALDENSPSRKMMEIGRFAIMGFALGIKKYSYSALGAMAKMGSDGMNVLSDTMSRMGDAVNDTINTNPVITPVVDLSDINRGNRSLNSMFSTGIGLTTNGANNNLPLDVVNPNSNQRIQNGSKSLNFTQINNSPKPLSRLEIYRQTKNQLRNLKGAMS